MPLRPAWPERRNRLGSLRRRRITDRSGCVDEATLKLGEEQADQTRISVRVERV